MLPNLIIFGTRKAGTTSLYNYLSQHPEIYMSDLKGTRYFLYDPENPENGVNIPIKSIEQYENMFDGAKTKNAKIIGEATPSYMQHKGVAARIKATLPDVKLIASLRNPVSRTYSHYLMDSRKRLNGKNVPLTLDNVHTWSKAGLYYDHLKEYYDIFPRAQIKILIFEHWIKDPLAVTKGIFNFLGVDDEFVPDLTTQYNKGGIPKSSLINSIFGHKDLYIKMKPYVPFQLRNWLNKLRGYNMMPAPPIDNEIKTYLQEYFKQDREKLEKLIEQDLSIWGKD